MQLVVSEPKQQANFVIIWMHGLGAGYEDMAGLAQSIVWPNENVRHVFLQAPDRSVTINGGMRMPAWYDILGTDMTTRQDNQGVSESSKLIEGVLNDQINQGIKPGQIFLAGFSQGGAMALYTGLNYDQKLAGIVALSAYIPCIDQLVLQLNIETPVFMGFGHFDPLVQPQWTKKSCDYLQQNGFHNITLKSYLIEHGVSPAEITDLQNWFSERMAGENE